MQKDKYMFSLICKETLDLEDGGKASMPYFACVGQKKNTKK